MPLVLPTIFNFWHSGTLALSPERQSDRMWKIRNCRLDQYGPERFRVQPFDITVLERVNHTYTQYPNWILLENGSYLKLSLIKHDWHLISKQVSHDIYRRRQSHKTPQRRRVVCITVQADKPSAAARTCSVRDCRRTEQTAGCSTLWHRGRWRAHFL